MIDIVYRFCYVVFVMNDVVSIKTAAKFLRVSIATVRRWCDSGKIPFHLSEGGHRRFYVKDLRSHTYKTDSIIYKSEK